MSLNSLNQHDFVCSRIQNYLNISTKIHFNQFGNLYLFILNNWKNTKRVFCYNMVTTVKFIQTSFGKSGNFTTSLRLIY